MAKDISEDMVAIAIKGAKITENVFKSAMVQALKQKEFRNTGKHRVNTLLKDGSSLQSIEINEQNIKSFEQSARKFDINYALKKERVSGTYLVFFKGKDIEQVYNAFSDYAKNHIQQEKDKPSVIKQIEGIKKEQALTKQPELERNKQKDRGMQL